MQIAINPNLYGTAQTYAEQKGLDLTLMIENFLKRFISKEKAKSQEQDLPDIVAGLLGAAHGEVAEEDLNGKEAYYQYIEEKYK